MFCYAFRKGCAGDFPQYHGPHFRDRHGMLDKRCLQVRALSNKKRSPKSCSAALNFKLEGGCLGFGRWLPELRTEFVLKLAVVGGDVAKFAVEGSCIVVVFGTYVRALTNPI